MATAVQLPGGIEPPPSPESSEPLGVCGRPDAVPAEDSEAGDSAYCGDCPDPHQEAEQHPHRRARAAVDPYRAWKLLAAGGVAGMVSRTATAPVDRLKMLLQIQDGVQGMTLKQGFQKMASEGTLRAFFKGNGTNVIKIAPETGIKLATNDRIKRYVVRDLDAITPGQRMICGGMAGATAQMSIYPLELIRTRLAVCPDGTYKGIRHAFQTIVKQEGGKAFYRGLVPSLIGIVPYAGVDIATFEILKEHLLDVYDGNPPPASILCAGMMSSSIAQFASYPLALVRTRLQAQGAGGTPLKYTGMTDVLRKTVKHEGFKGLYKGVLPNMIKLAPAAGISWFTFEEVKRLLGMDIRS
ncbi:hypothetical protein WJX72_010986 [[Myrmecia] bisecta]|uniref:Uncharacterized protein n=1 Tax=[Myrmecia] bisecta TaxID=41462 RepID=A0AAW1PM84_9CHLO